MNVEEINESDGTRLGSSAPLGGKSEPDKALIEEAQYEWEESDEGVDLGWRIDQHGVPSNYLDVYWSAAFRAGFDAGKLTDSGASVERREERPERPA